MRSPSETTQENGLHKSDSGRSAPEPAEWTARSSAVRKAPTNSQSSPPQCPSDRLCWERYLRIGISQFHVRRDAAPVQQGVTPGLCCEILQSSKVKKFPRKHGISAPGKTGEEFDVLAAHSARWRFDNAGVYPIVNMSR